MRSCRSFVALGLGLAGLSLTLGAQVQSRLSTTDFTSEQVKMLQEYSQAVKAGALQTWLHKYTKFNAKTATLADTRADTSGSVRVDLTFLKDGAAPTQSGVVYAPVNCREHCMPRYHGTFESLGIDVECTVLKGCFYDKERKKWMCQYSQCTLTVAGP